MLKSRNYSDTICSDEMRASSKFNRAPPRFFIAEFVPIMGRFWTCLVVVVIIGHRSCAAEDAVASLQVRHPLPFQVVQRSGFDPRRAHEHEPNGPALGAADVTIECDVSVAKEVVGEKTVFTCRAVPLQEAFGSGTDWAIVRGKLNDHIWSGQAHVPAGGWYKLEIEAKNDDRVVAKADVEPFGVGEIFIIAGQSYASGTNDELMKIDDARGRIVAYDTVNKSWRIANDPQPNCGDGGTIWPSLGNLLLPLARVPIGFINVAASGTSTRQWLPGEKLYEQLRDAGKEAGRFRAVLWQQGESDVIEHRSTEYYVQNLVTIRERLATDWGFSPPWLLAKSTLHPTVYKDIEGEARIRAAIDQLWGMPGFRPGPDTDILGGENRGPIGTRQHFSGIGQRRAGLMWFAAVWCELNSRN